MSTTNSTPSIPRSLAAQPDPFWPDDPTAFLGGIPPAAPAEPADKKRKPYVDNHRGTLLRLDDDVAETWHLRRKELELLLRLCATKGVTPDVVRDIGQDLRDMRVIMTVNVAGPLPAGWLERALRVTSKLLGRGTKA